MSITKAHRFTKESLMKLIEDRGVGNLGPVRDISEEIHKALKRTRGARSIARQKRRACVADLEKMDALTQGPLGLRDETLDKLEQLTDHINELNLLELALLKLKYSKTDISNNKENN